MDVPKDRRTLMNTSKKHNITNTGSGMYVHFGFENIIKPMLPNNKINLPDS